MSLTWRYATKEDAVLIADLSRQTFYETFAEQNTAENMQLFLDHQFTRGKLIMEVGAPENTFLLAYVNDEVAGYAKLKEGKKPGLIKHTKALEIARLYACKNMIGKGVGRLLMQQSINIAVERNMDMAWLGVWEKNETAIKFYTKWGFKKFDEHQFVLGNDVQNDWLMKKELK